MLGSSPASGSGFPWLASQSQQVGSIPIADGIAPEFLARHTVDRDLRDSIDQSAGTVNGTSHWNGALGEAFHMYPGYPVHLAQGSPASNGGIPHGYIWNQSSFQAACSDSSLCPTHVRQPVPTATLTMSSQLCAWDNRLGPVGLIQTSCHGMYTANCTDLLYLFIKRQWVFFFLDLSKSSDTCNCLFCIPSRTVFCAVCSLYLHNYN